jgi:membrane protease YdiL (CAAX protease family)
MSKFSAKQIWRAIAYPKVRLPADFPFSPVSSGKLYLKSLVCYVIGTLVPTGLFIGLSTYAIKFNLPLADLMFADKNFYLLLAVFSVITFLSGFGAQFFYVRKQIHKQGRLMRDVLALNTKNFEGSTLKLIGWGVVTCIVAAVIQQAIGAIWPLPIKDPTADLINKMHGLSFAMMALLAVIGPIFEEIIFRGFLFGGLRTALHKRLPAPDAPGYATKLQRYDLLASFGSALVFGLAHMNLAGLVLYVAIGMVFAEAYRRSGSLYVPIIGHFLNNGAIVLLMLVLTKG